MCASLFSLLRPAMWGRLPRPTVGPAGAMGTTGTGTGAVWVFGGCVVVDRLIGFRSRVSSFLVCFGGRCSGRRDCTVLLYYVEYHTLLRFLLLVGRLDCPSNSINQLLILGEINDKAGWLSKCANHPRLSHHPVSRLAPQTTQPSVGQRVQATPPPSPPACRRPKRLERARRNLPPNDAVKNRYPCTYVIRYIAVGSWRYAMRAMQSEF